MSIEHRSLRVCVCDVFAHFVHCLGQHFRNSARVRPIQKSNLLSVSVNHVLLGLIINAVESTLVARIRLVTPIEPELFIIVFIHIHAHTHTHI